MVKEQILCISAGMQNPKKQDNPIARLHMYLNYGLLGLASILHERGYQPSVVHGLFQDPADFVKKLAAQGHLQSSLPILISLPSSLAIPWARIACATIRTLAPQARIVIGGRWVVADDPSWIKSQLPQADEFVEGLAEDRIEHIIDPHLRSSLRLQNPGGGFAPSLNYILLDRWRDFQPSIEVSRGCGMHCNFCAEAEVALSAMKQPVQVVAELAAYESLVAGEEYHPYFESSIFRPTSKWIQGLSEELVNHSIRMQWRAESRVDSLSSAFIPALKQTGLRVLDLGLESGSPDQLIAMRKTKTPDTYLSKASNLLRTCHENGVWTKVNVLLYPGESWDTLKQTTDWLDRHRCYIKGLSVGPTILYRFGQSSKTLLHEFERLGASAVASNDLDEKGYAHLHLSSAIGHDAAMAFSAELSRDFMTSRDYYDLKSFSYLPRGFSWETFQESIAGVAAEKLPFRV